MGESLLSTSLVAPGQLNQRHTALGIELDILGFRNLLFSMNSSRKKDRELGRGEKNQGFFIFFKELEGKKDVRKVLL